ncbi:MAG: hypothetical protein NT011_00340 [Kiritimatiellaeota bacterium]|nr:hypothetical protein [Kiritimatiellota bacterium]
MGIVAGWAVPMDAVAQTGDSPPTASATVDPQMDGREPDDSGGDARDTPNAPAVASQNFTIDIPTTDAPAKLPQSAESRNGNNSLITITLNAVPASEVVDMFSLISGANIIITGGLSNSAITANLKNVEWKTALSLALDSVNLSLIEDQSGILTVVTAEMYQEKLRQIENTKPLITKCFILKYLQAIDFIEQIKKLKIMSPRGTIITSQSREQERLNLKSSPLTTEIIQNPGITTEVIVTDIKEYVEKVARLIRELDKREPQVFIEVRVIDVLSDDSKKTGFDWSMLDSFGATLKLQDLKWSFSDVNDTVNSTVNSVKNYDNRGNVDTVNNRYNLNGQQYEESATTYEESPPGSDNWVSKTVVTPTRTIVDTIASGKEISSTKTDTSADTYNENKSGTAILSVSDLSLFLSFLQKNENTEMISHPLIVVGNKVEAKIHVGERYPTVISTKQSANPQQGQTESFSERVEWNDLGITLWVIPEIDHALNIVRMTVNPQMSTHVKDITTAAGSVYPVISTRQVSTRVNVPSKHTVVIGGLIENTKTQKEIKVPILGDIPLLGYLFKHNEDVITKHNLLILLTPTILNELAPLTGMEIIAQQSVDRLEKELLAPKGDLTLKPAATTNSPNQAASMTSAVPAAPSSSANIVPLSTSVAPAIAESTPASTEVPKSGTPGSVSSNKEKPQTETGK